MSFRKWKEARITDITGWYTAAVESQFSILSETQDFINVCRQQAVIFSKQNEACFSSFSTTEHIMICIKCVVPEAGTKARDK